MSYANGIIKDSISGNGDGVSVYDVQQALGDVAGGGTALTENGLNALCTHVNINPWARFKPERSLPFTSQEIQAGKPVGKYQLPLDHNTRKVHNFGLEVPYCITWQDMHWTSNCMNGMINYLVYEDHESDEDQYIPWKYLTPRGNRISAEQNPSAEFYRLSDFVRLEGDSNGPTFSQLPGYNHYALDPFNCWMDTEGVRTYPITIDGVEVLCYEHNTAENNNLRIWFQNSSGYDLHLNDFIDFGSSSYTWKPVVQIYCNDSILNSSNPNLQEDWWERTTPDIEIIGDSINSNQGSNAWYIDIPLNNFDISSQAKIYYHLCVGIGCFDNLNNYKDSSKSLFIVPCTRKQLLDRDFPFYYCVVVYNHEVYNLKFKYLNWFDFASATRDTIGPVENSYFNVTYTAKGSIAVEFTMKQTNQNLFFAPSTYSQDSLDGYTTIKMRAVEKDAGGNIISDVNNPYNLKPISNINTRTIPSENQGGYKIDSGTGTVTLKAELENSTISNTNLPEGSSRMFYVQTKLGNDTNWTDAGVFTVHKNNR